MNERTARALGLLFLLAGCGAGTLDAPHDSLGAEDVIGVSTSEARVTPAQAQQAFAAVKAVDYLPFGYTEDGCYARALYMAMELAARKVPSSAQFISGELWPSEDIAWSYHVAPMIWVAGSTELTILDPSLAPSPVNRDDWVKRTGPVGRYRLYWTPGSDTYPDGWELDYARSGPMVQSFDELPAFEAAYVSHACGTMYAYLQGESLSPTDLAAKRQRLLDRTEYLVRQLVSLGKLDGYRAGSGLRCTRTITLHP